MKEWLHGTTGSIVCITLCEHAYRDKSQLKILHELDISGVQALVVEIEQGPVLVICGTNERADWRTNLRVIGNSSWVETGQSGARYAGGWLSWARMVYGFAKDRGCVAATGHSAGGATVSIVGPSLALPTVTFASPRPLISGEVPGSCLVLNRCRHDDMVPRRLPPPRLGFQHIGAVRWFHPQTRHRGSDHGCTEYLAALTGDEPGTWQ